MKPTVGVAIATYNGQEFLLEQLESIEAQTLKPTLIVISDDASTDNTLAIVEAFQTRTLIPMRILRNRIQQGVIVNFLKAFEACDTDYIAYCDQDDYWVPTKLMTCVSRILQGNVSLVFHSSTISDDRLISSGRFEPNNIPDGRYLSPYFPDYLWGFGHQMLFSRATLETLQRIYQSSSPSVEKIGGGFDFALLFAAGIAGDIVFIKRELIKFRRHTLSVSPAGKARERSPNVADNCRRRKRIESVHLLITDILHAIRSNEFAASPESSVSEQYVRHLACLNRRYELRQTVYSNASRLEKLRAMTILISTKSYGSIKRNRIPIRQIPLDLLRVAF